MNAKSQEIVQHEARPPAITDAFVQMVERAAANPAVDVDKLERLLTMRKDMELRAAEQSFNEAMTEAQAQMHPISADASNPQTKSKYASYAALDRVLRPIYTSKGFSLSFDTGEGAPPDTVRVLCYVARGAYTRTYRVDMPADGKGAKGGDVMTKTHAAGSAFTYGARYLLKMIFNVAIGDARDDDDGNAAGTTYITEAQVAELQRAIMDADIPLPKFFKVMKIERLNDLPANRFADAKAQIADVVAMRAKKQAAAT